MTLLDDTSSTLTPYYEALNRLVNGNSTIVLKGSKITLNSVAIEAGKSPGSIKKSREVYAALIREIKIRATEQQQQEKPGSSQVRQAKDRAAKAVVKARNYESLYKEALARELMLLIAWDEATQELRKVSKVVPLKTPERP